MTKDRAARSDAILFELQKDGVALLTFNRPDAKNVFDGAMLDALGAAYARCDADDAIRVVVVTGSGNTFCAGADMGARNTAPATAAATANKVPDISSCPLSCQAWEVRKPVIAACNGHAVGVGLSIALQADLRVFAEEGKYGLLQNRRGVVADFAVEYLLPRLVGMERAFELLVRAPRLSGAEAVAWGLASRVVPAAQVVDTALEIARDMAVNCAPLVMGMHKRLLWRGLDMNYSQLVELETRALQYSMDQPDAAEGGLAWLERRAPQWQGRLGGDWPDWLD